MFTNSTCCQTSFETHDISAVSFLLFHPVSLYSTEPFNLTLQELSGNQQSVLNDTKEGKENNNNNDCLMRGNNTDLLERESWFHGKISRKESEQLVTQDGNFLVRESQAQEGQFVLTGMEAGECKHLLLVDPEGVVRTMDRAFDSVSHLVDFHQIQSLPIVSETAESSVYLRNPVNRGITISRLDDDNEI